LACQALIEYLVGRDLSCQEPIVPKSMVADPGVKSMMSGVTFATLGGAHFLSRHRRTFAVNEYLVICAVALCFVSGACRAFGSFPRKTIEDASDLGKTSDGLGGRAL
jgi:hypothetical protein